MSDANFPPVSPVTRPNQFQKSLYPFDAFSFDDPNLTANPVLRIKSPWSFSAGAPLQPLSAAPSGNTSFTLPSVYPAQYQIYIPAAYLVASSGGPFTLTITTGSGATVVVPIAANGDTIASGALLFNIYVDGSGNVTSDAWSITAYNSKGLYKANSDASCEQWQNFSQSVTCNSGPVDGFYVCGLAWAMPRSFSSTGYVFTGLCKATGHYAIVTGNQDSQTVSAAYYYILCMTSFTTVTTYQELRAIGTWR